MQICNGSINRDLGWDRLGERWDFCPKIPRKSQPCKISQALQTGKNHVAMGFLAFLAAGFARMGFLWDTFWKKACYNSTIKKWEEPGVQRTRVFFMPDHRTVG